MKKIVFSSFSISLVLLAVACAPGGNHAGRSKNAAQKADGAAKVTAALWIEKTEANALRATGKIDEKCETNKKELKPEPILYQTDASGNVFTRSLEANFNDENRLGQITPNGFVLSESAKNQGLTNLEIKEANGELMMNYGKVEGFKEGDMVVFVQSNEEELQKYFAAAEQCKIDANQSK